MCLGVLQLKYSLNEDTREFVHYSFTNMSVNLRTINMKQLFDQNLNEIVRRLYWLFKTEKAPPLS